ncbi:BlaI/MecI/CopY family transcriptional regulator [Allocoleopsis franciscana]|uniref:Putative transcriptional regulator n=1 Tax=Allocoleopsis franciscana PCC 7113 TaxID=1173027 RepID=K9WJF5_9CYAN|nr:BlaI/MecI/CopY family transcriptional regulator [Allocoleopsis franciscana]AFZ20323.1 putative transcriptional regulator [Allocoleopsis franciscana PCC 7113]
MEKFSEEIQRFIIHNVKTIDCLKILLFFKENSNEKWTIYNIGKKLYLHHTTVKEILKFLNKRGFLKIERQDKEHFYSYNPKNDDVDNMIEQLAQLDRYYPVSLINFIYSLSKNPIQSFADAFKLKSEEEE